MSIDNILMQSTAEAVKALYGLDFPADKVTLQTTKKEFEGNLTVVVFPFLKASRKGPEPTGQEIGEYLVANCEAVQSFNVIKGFLNIVIKPSFWASVLSHIAADANYGFKQETPESELVMIEYSSPNTNKPLHLGHVRNNLLGYSLSEIMKANGYKVVKTNIVNDRGIHICKSMLAWQKWGNGITPEKAGKKGDHLIGDFYVLFDKHYKAEVKSIMENDPEVLAISLEDLDKTMEARKAAAEAKSPLMKEAREMLKKWEAGDEEVRSVWRMMNESVYAGFDATYKRMGVDFDKIYYESDTYLEGKEKVLEGLEKGIMYRREDNSVWADLTADGLDHKLLLRSDGTSVYMTQDIGTAKLRYQDYPIDKMIYVVGNEQNYHFQVLSLLLDKLGFKWGKDLVHFSYGMVELPEGKMKSREGTVVDADDLMDEMVKSALDTILEREAENATKGKPSEFSDEEKNEIARIVGLGALKYFLIKVDPRKNMMFNPRESIDFNGNTGPFIQYTYARIQSLLRKANAADLAADFSGVEPNEKEVALIQRLSDFPATIHEAGVTYSPALIANYVYELVKEFNQYYHGYTILGEEDAQVRAFRLALSNQVATIARRGIALLGIEVPSRM
ncbi:MAG: arginine--tRNA ligase [Muribaculaceae bacterium]|nr:arginine--tRNA ligase [Muribaculaceae bacterium]